MKPTFKAVEDAGVWRSARSMGLGFRKTAAGTAAAPTLTPKGDTDA
jgi:hypothetical protein